MAAKWQGGDGVVGLKEDKAKTSILM